VGMRRDSYRNKLRAQRARMRRRRPASPSRRGGFEVILLILILVLISVLALNLNQGHNVTVPTSKLDHEYPPSELLDDLSFLMNTLEQVHPNLYAFVSPAEIQAELHRIEATLTVPMTRLTFYRIVAPLVSRFKDGHTMAVPPREERREYTSQGALLFPLDLNFGDGQVTVTHNFTSDSLVNPGTRVLAINGVPIEQIEARLLQYVSGQRDAWRRQVLTGRFRWQMWLVYGFESPYTVTVQRNTIRGATRVDRTFLGITLEELKARQSALKQQPEEPPFTFRVLDGDAPEGVALLDMNRFAQRDRFTTFLDSVFTVIQDDAVWDLIIDVRGDGGGNSVLGDQLIRYIYDKPYAQTARMDVKVSKQIRKHFASWLPWYVRWNPTMAGHFYKRLWDAPVGAIVSFEATPDSLPANPLRFKGRIYLLVDAGTFSSATMFAATLKDYGIATLIGEETGGLATAYGELYPFQLPNTHLAFSCSSKRFLRPSGVDDGRGVIPDVEVNPADFANRPNVDPELATALKVIEERRLALANGK